MLTPSTYEPTACRPRLLTLVPALVAACAALSLAEEGEGRARDGDDGNDNERHEHRAPVGPVVKAVAEGDVPRGAALARELVASGRAGERETAALRMLLTEKRAGLVGGLVAKRADLRAACAWALGWIRDWESAAEVEVLLADAEPTVRLEAARALGEFGEDRLAEALTRASADADARVRASALESLRKLGAGFEVAVRALEDESDEVRHAAAKLLGEVRASGPEFEKLAALALDGALSYEPGEVGTAARFAAVRALGRLKVDEAVPALLRVARDEDGRLATAAVRALGDVGGEEAARALVAVLEETAQADGPVDSPLRGEAVQALGRAGVRSRGVIGALSAILREAPLDLVRRAADALGALGGDEAREALVEASGSDRTEIHGPVAVAAARLEEYRPVSVLLRELAAGDDWTALGAARALAETGNPAGFPVFIGALRSADERVRAFAATCLALYSGQNMDLWTDGPAAERERIAGAWRRWWLRNRSTFVVRRPGADLAR